MNKINLAQKLSNYYGTELYFRNNLEDDLVDEILYTEGVFALKNILNNNELFNNIIRKMKKIFNDSEESIIFGELFIKNGKMSISIYDDIDGKFKYDYNLANNLENFEDCIVKLFIQDNIVCLLSEY